MGVETLFVGTQETFFSIFGGGDANLNKTLCNGNASYLGIALMRTYKRLSISIKQNFKSAHPFREN